MRKWTIQLLLAGGVISATAGAVAQSTRPNLVGDWRGSYICLQGATGLTLSIDRQSGDTFSGYFHFYPLRTNPAAKQGCFSVQGRLDGQDHVTISAQDWITQPDGYVTVGLDGELVEGGASMRGSVVGPVFVDTKCQDFTIAWQGRRTKISRLCRTNGLQALSGGDPQIR